jgi:23S rRNA (guanosine2251-2'-O)-methyltransferase
VTTTRPPRPPQRRPRSELGGEQVEGRRAVRELLVARRRPVRDVWISETADGSALDEIVELAAAASAPVRRVARSRLDAEARTDAPQGVLAHARALQPTDLDALCRRAAAAPFLLALDGVTDPQNLGAVLRTAEIAGVSGVVLPRHRAVHITPAVAKAAAGAIEYLPIAVVAGLAGALLALREQGIWTVGLDPEAPTSLFELQVATEPVLVVLGAEGSGLSRLVADRCDVRVAIPQSGHLGSLNVAAAGALALFEVARRRLG